MTVTGTQANQDIYTGLNNDFNAMNALADGLANGSNCVELPNMPIGNTSIDSTKTTQTGYIITADSGGANRTFVFNSKDAAANWINSYASSNGYSNFVQVGYGTVTSNTANWWNNGTGSVGNMTANLTSAPTGNPNDNNMTIDASSLGPGQLFAVSQSASNTDTKDQVATIAPTKLDGIEKSAVRDAKS